MAHDVIPDPAEAAAAMEKLSKVLNVLQNREQAE
jgi:hypothetical protein